MATFYATAGYIQEDYVQSAITMIWNNNEIFIPKIAMTQIQAVPTEIWQLDIPEFKITLGKILEDAEGMVFPDIFNHNPSVSVGGVILSKVVEILEPYTVTFEDGQYAVNLVGANSNIGDRVNVNQVSVRSANSAGLQDLSTLLASAYGGQVVIDTGKGQSGTSTPIGTFKAPVNNVQDALIIAKTNGIQRLLFMDSIDIKEDLSTGYQLVGISPYVVLDCFSEADLTACSFEYLSAKGELDGLNTLRGCAVFNITNVSGFIEKCSFKGIVTMNADMMVMESYSNIQGHGYPIIKIISGDLVVRDLHGSLGLADVTSGIHSIGIYGGRLIIESTCVGGYIHVRGEPFDIVDNSGSGCTVIIETEGHKISEIHGQITRAVYIDTELVDNGNGYQQTPYNNWSDAVDNAESHGIKHLVLLSDAVIDRQLKNFIITGIGTPKLDTNGQNIDRSEFKRLTLKGLYTGSIIVQESNLTDTFNLNGFFENCSFGSNFVIPDNGVAFIKNCSSFIDNTGDPIFNIGSNGILSLTDHSGNIQINDFETGAVNIDMSSGKVTIDQSCIDGIIYVQGVTSEVLDNSTLNCNVINKTNTEVLWRYSR